MEELPNSLSSDTGDPLEIREGRTSWGASGLDAGRGLQPRARQL